MEVQGKGKTKEDMAECTDMEDRCGRALNKLSASSLFCLSTSVSCNSSTSKHILSAFYACAYVKNCPYGTFKIVKTKSKF